MQEQPTTIDYGRGKAAELRRAVHERLLEHEAAGGDALPTSNRFIFYELRQSGGPLYGWPTRAEGRSEDQNLSGPSKWLRDAGIVPWAWMVDETRSLTAYRYAATVAEYLIDTIDQARLDCWDGEPAPLIICEPRTFGGVLERTLAPEYLCPVTATGGQVGGFLHTNVAPWLIGNERRVLYVGDLDLAGGDIEGNTRRVLEDAATREFGDGWTRVALTAEQGRNLPKVKKVDRRFRPTRSTRRSKSKRSGKASSRRSSVLPSTTCSRSRFGTYRYARRSSESRSDGGSGDDKREAGVHQRRSRNEDAQLRERPLLRTSR
jgi:hypothetical protein